MTVASKIEQKGIEKRTFDIAKNMLRKHVDINFIKDITGLSLEKISAIQAVLG